MRFGSFTPTFDAKLGRCVKCMRTMLAVAIAGWFALGAGWLVWSAGPLVFVAALWPIGFTALWLLHVGTFAARKVANLQRRNEGGLAGKEDSPDIVGADRHKSTSSVGIGKTLRIFIRAVGIGVSASLGSSLPELDEFELRDAYREALRIRDEINRKGH
jgi:hypothetical protein